MTDEHKHDPVQGPLPQLQLMQLSPKPHGGSHEAKSFTGNRSRAETIKNFVIFDMILVAISFDRSSANPASSSISIINNSMVSLRFAIFRRMLGHLKKCGFEFVYQYVFQAFAGVVPVRSAKHPKQPFDFCDS